MSSLSKKLSITVVSIYGSICATAMVVRTIIYGLIPPSMRHFIASKFSEYEASEFASKFTFVIEKGCEAVDNGTYYAVEAYLPTLIASTDSLSIGSSNDFCSYLPSLPKFEFAIPFGAKLKDKFEGMFLEWSIHCKEARKCYYNDEKSFHLTCKNNDRDAVVEKYFPHVIQSAQSILKKREKIYIHTYIQDYGMWESTIFHHKSTFDTLAMDLELKQSVMADLGTFVNSSDHLDNVGISAWKRSFILYGPSGSGKTSLVAAIANYIRFNIYDLQLQSIRSNTELRHILMSTTNYSILLVENVDSIVLEDEGGHANYKTTVSSLVDLIEELGWSFRNERIIIFTTESKDKLDPVLLRPGRIDIEIEMGYCSAAGFRLMAKTYRVGLEDDKKFGTITNLIESVKVTPAEVAEYFLRYDFPRLALEHLLIFLKKKLAESKEEEDKNNSNAGFCTDICT